MKATVGKGKSYDDLMKEVKTKGPINPAPKKPPVIPPTINIPIMGGGNPYEGVTPGPNPNPTPPTKGYPDYNGGIVQIPNIDITPKPPKKDPEKEKLDELYKKVGTNLDLLKRRSGLIAENLMQPEFRRGRQAIAEKMNALKHHYSQKGLLNSGQRRSAAAEEYGSGLASAEGVRRKSNETIQDNISELENLYQQAGLKMSGASLNADYQNQLSALNERISQLKEYADLGKGAGQIGGYYIANQGEGSSGSGGGSSSITNKRVR
jgi:hypothetical protein